MSSFTIVRSISIEADPAQVHALINDFHAWRSWSPWEDIDPDMERTFSGPDSGVGARYAWRGNRKAGAGSMEITSSQPFSIVIRISFLKPMKATHQVDFAITPDQGRSQVAWTMTGEQKGLAAIFGRVFNMDRLVGKDFERGLARLKTVAEAAR